MRSLDLPLDQTAVSRFLPWILASLLYLGLIAFAVAAIADGALRLFDQRAKLVTVTLPAAASVQQSDFEMAQVLDTLGRAPEVTSAASVSDEDLQDLIEPWVNDDRPQADMPLPRLIDVSLKPESTPDLEALERQIQQIVPGATIGIQTVSRDRSERQANFFRALGIVIGGFMLITSLVLVGVITSLSLSMHGDTVALLRYMGAQDGYLARQFERYALQSGLKGGFIGFIAAMLTVVLLLYSIQSLELTNSIRLGLRPVDWIFLACVPMVSALLCTAMARLTALWGLGRLS